MTVNPYASGRPIANANTPNKKGTLCCRLYHPQQNKFYLLTCNHVMHACYSYDNNGLLDKAIPTIPGGNWVWGKRNRDLDVALIAISSETDFEYPKSLIYRHPRKLNPDDVLNTTIFMVGRDAFDYPKIVSGKIINICHDEPINVGYFDGEYPFNGLILISQAYHNGQKWVYQTLSSPGDSGALVYDENGCPIGMAIAGNDQFTYVLPFERIISATGTAIA